MAGNYVNVPFSVLSRVTARRTDDGDDEDENEAAVAPPLHGRANSHLQIPCLLLIQMSGTEINRDQLMAS